MKKVNNENESCRMKCIKLKYRNVDEEIEIEMHQNQGYFGRMRTRRCEMLGKEKKIEKRIIKIRDMNRKRK